MAESSEFKDLLVTKIAPILGVFTSEFLALGPLSAVLACRKSKSLGELNPLIFPLLFGNSIGWVIYSAATRNPYIFAANAGAVVLSLFYLLSAYSLSTCPATKSRLEVISLFLLTVWCSMGFSAAMMQDKQLGISMLGVMGNIVVFLLFASPLATFSKVISTKDSSSINRPFAFCQVLNCLIWLLYGTAISDIYVALPNLVGLSLGVVQVLLIFIYRAGRAIESALPVVGEDGSGVYEKFERPSA
jgi:solute carrier family 50 (sugar transporter)